MKRQRPTFQGPQKDITLQDVYQFFETHQLTCDEWRALIKEVNIRYNEAESLVTNLPSDHWLAIFSRIRPRGLPKTDFKFWLACRMVSKSWKSAISTMDFSRILPGAAVVQYDPNRVLKMFHFSQIHISRPLLDVSLLANIKWLRLDHEAIPLDIAEEVLKLTQLTHLHCSKDPIPESILLQLTNLTSLRLDDCSTIGTLNSLTRLTQLSIWCEDVHLKPDALKYLTRLVDIRSNNPKTFHQGTGTCFFAAPRGIYYYQGEFLNGQPHGQGVGYYPRGFSSKRMYQGPWKAGEAQGHGITFFFTDGSFYEGPHIRGHFKGTGLRKYRRCFGREGVMDTYTGEFNWVEGTKNGQKHGFGTYKFVDGTVYEGTWAYDEFVNGKCSYINGDVYEGELKYGGRDGQGEYIVKKNWRRMEGRWSSDSLLRAGADLKWGDKTAMKHFVRSSRVIDEYQYYWESTIEDPEPEEEEAMRQLKEAIEFMAQAVDKNR